MEASYINKLSLNTTTPLSASPMGTPRNAFANGDQASFKSVLMDTAGNLNNAISAPDKMLTDAITNGSHDIHDVMLASAKAELMVTMTAQVTTKVVQAYDRVLQIQI